jgi:hypothetical protein
VKAQQSAKEIETLGPAQARTFLKTKRGYRLEALYGLAVTTSMGQGELLRLRWEDKDLDVGAVQVRRTRWRMLTADFSVVDPQRMMCTYGPAQGVLFNHSYMHGMCGSVSTQYAVTSSGLQYGCNKSEPGQHRGFCSYPTRILNSACKQ